MEDKPWYRSKTVWAAILLFLLALLEQNDLGGKLGLVIPWDVLKTALAGLGLYGLREAQGRINKS